MAEMTRTCPGNSHCLTAMMAVCTVQPVSVFAMVLFKYSFELTRLYANVELRMKTRIGGTGSKVFKTSVGGLPAIAPYSE